MAQIKYHEERVLEAIQQCWDESNVDELMMSEYRRWQQSHEDRAELPAGNTIGSADRFIALCESMGIPTVTKPHTSARVLYTKRSVEAEVRRFLEETEVEEPEAKDYKLWQAEQSSPCPTHLTVYNHLGDWPTVMSRFGVDVGESRQTAPVGSASLEVLAGLILVVEGLIGPSPTMAAWTELRSERPDLDLPAATWIQSQKHMPWRELVSPDRTWPSHYDVVMRAA